MQRLVMFNLAAIPLLTAAAVFINTAALADGATNDTVACYSWDLFPDERLNLNIRGGGPLSSPQDENNFNHPAQRTHGVHAKHVGVCGDETNGSVEGVVLVAAATGAHMGLHTMATRGAEKRGGRETCRPVFLDCYSDEASKAPQSWTCQSRNEFGAYHGQSTLTRIAMDTAPNDPLCAQFEDDDSFEHSNKGRGSRVASGTVGSDQEGERDEN